MTLNESDAKSPVVVVTGGTRGIGRALAKAFLDSGWRVMITGRSRESLDKACQDLPAGNLAAEVCELSNPRDIAQVWKSTVEAFGRVDVWLNNAGMSVPSKPYWEHKDADLELLAATNFTGSLLVGRIVGKAMADQGFGYLYFMEGLGSHDEYQESMIAYGASKYGVAYLARKLCKAMKGSKVNVGALSPGMVVTDLLLADAGGLAGINNLTPRMKGLYNILADRAETVGPWLVGKLIADHAKPPKPGKFRRHAWLTTLKVFGRFATAGFAKRDVFTV